MDETSQTPLTGGCLCGAVRYEISGDILMSGNCHCRNCQRHTGGAFAELIVLKQGSIQITAGETTTFTHPGDSGKFVYRRGCAVCGSGIVIDYDVTPDLTALMAGTLDDPSAFTPVWNIYTASRQPWLTAGATLKDFDGGFKAS